MLRRLHQAPRAAALLAVVSAVALAARAGATEPVSYRPQLAAECDALIRSAVKTPYGWGWAGASAAAQDPKQSGGTARPSHGRFLSGTTIDTRTTAAAGLALHMAARQLNEPKYNAAAIQAARVLAAVQAHSGQVPATGIIRGNAGGSDEPAAVPSRGATCATLALLLTLAHDADASAGEDAAADSARIRSLRPAAVKAANWLATQQTKLGGWPVEYAPQDAAGPSTQPIVSVKRDRPLRLIRLDLPETRDANYALWLAASVLDDAKLRRHAEAGVKELSVLSIEDEKTPGHDLWAAAYTLDEEPVKSIPALPYGADLAATHYAMQALLAASLMGDGEEAPLVLNDAAAALERLPKRDGKWCRYYGLSRLGSPGPEKTRDKEVSEATVSTVPEPGIFQAGPDAPTEPADDSAPAGIGQTLHAARQLAELGPQKYAQLLSTSVPVEWRLASTICGFDDDALTADPPVDMKQRGTYLDQYKSLFAVLDAPPPHDLATRFQRIGLLLRRVRLEGEPADGAGKREPLDSR